MDQKVQTARSQIEQFKKDKYHFDPETGRCLLPEDAKSDYDNALKILSEQLYTKDIHFIFELIQNAEDNHYAQDVAPTLSFELLAHDPTNTAGCKGCLVVRNNESGFEMGNIRAISSIGKSTKANQKDAGYIGEKGIGFKSVFVVSPAPHIISNGFQIKFLKDDPKTGLGYIVPYWLDANFGDFSNGTGTTLLLPLQDRLGNQESMFEKVHDELRKLSAELILFLRKLKKLSIRTPNYYADYELSKNGDHAELMVKSSTGESHSKYLLKSKTVSVTEEAKSSLRENVSKRDVALAFPIGVELKESPLFCYLPTESDTGLPFLVNADFILNASREAIRQDLAWNSWMLEELATFAASTLAEVLSIKGDLSRWTWVPVNDSSPQHLNYWRIVGEKVIDELSHTACIPTLSGKYLLPSEALLLGQSFKFLKNWPQSILGRLTKQLAYDRSGNISRVSQKIGLQRFAKQNFLELIQALQTNDTLTEEQLIDALVEITSVKTDVYSRGYTPYKYRDNTEILRNCLIFKCDSGLQSAKYKNLYLPSDESHEVPILVNDKGESTKPNYIDKDFYSLIPEHVKTGIRILFDVDEVNAISYLEQSVYTFLKEHQTSCVHHSLEAVSKYLISNIEDLPEDTVELLREELPYKNTTGSWIFPKTHSRFVAPSSLYDLPSWKQIYQFKEELQHIFELHEDYLTWGNDELVQLFLESFQIDEFVHPFVLVQQGGSKFTATPISFTKDEYWEIEANRLAALKWLYWVYEDEDLIVAASNNKLELGYFLLNNRWLMSTNEGLVQPSPLLHRFSDSERRIFGNSLNYLKDPVTREFAKKLGLVTEPTPKGFMDQIKVNKENGGVNLEFLTSAYDSLSNWRDPNDAERIKRRLTQEQLVYLPEPRNEWLSPKQVTWENKPDLGSSFVGLAEYLPERLKHYFVEMLGVKANHGLASYLSAYQEQTNLNEKLSNKKLVQLNTIVRYLSQLIRNDDFSSDITWKEFKAISKVCSDKGKWLRPDDEIFVADDGKIKELFLDHPDVHFTWSPATEFYSFFEHLGVRKLSESIDVEISKVYKEQIVDVPKISTSAKKAICIYIADHFDVNDELSSKLSNFYHAKELTCEKLLVKYTLDEQQFIEVDSELGFYDAIDGSLVLVRDQDIDNVKDELAFSIARVFFGRKVGQYEKSIRIFVDIQTESRLSNVLKKEALELDDEKLEVLENIFKSESNELFDAEDELDIEENTITKVGVEVHGEHNATSEYDTGIASSDEISDSLKVDDVVDRDEAREVNYGVNADENISSDNEFIDGEIEERNSEVSSNQLQEVRAFDDVSSKIGSYNHYREERGGIGNNERRQSSSASSHINDRKPYAGNKSSQHGAGSPANRRDGSTRESSNNTNGEPKQQTAPSVGYRLFSYVESENTHDRTEKEAREDASFGQKAETFVKQWLHKEGFQNVEMYGGNNKGFDIQAINPDTGELIFVEVKGQRSAWNRTGIALSQSQMEKCLQEGDSYWLIVVENLLTTPTIHKFVNPAKLIDRYYFDSNWSKVAELLKAEESPEIALDDLFFDDSVKSIYEMIIKDSIALPEVGYEISNESFEVVAELELAWPDEKVGVYIEPPEGNVAGWRLLSADEISKDINLLFALVPSNQLLHR